MSEPVPVAASTSRRHRAGAATANCWASPPPQERPRTSTSRRSPSRSQHAGRSPGRTSTGRRGRPGVGEPPTPGTSNRMTVRRAVQRVDERLQHLQARADAVHQQQRQPRARSGARRTDTRRQRPPDGRSSDSSRRRPARLLVEAHRCPGRRRGPSQPRPPSSVGARDLTRRVRSPSQRREVRPPRALARSPAPASHASASSAGVATPAPPGSVDFGLPGGLTSEAMCPLVERMNRLSPPSSCGGAVAGLPRAEVVGDARGDVDVDGRPSTGPPACPSMVAPLPGSMSELRERDVDEVAVQRRASSGWCRRSRTGCRSSAAACPAGSC